MELLRTEIRTELLAGRTHAEIMDLCHVDDDELFIIIQGIIEQESKKPIMMSEALTAWTPTGMLSLDIPVMKAIVKAGNVSPAVIINGIQKRQVC